MVSDTYTHFLAYCPFHNNTDSPAFAIDKKKGLWTCFNPSCESKGTLYMLLGRLKGLNYFEATRLILKNKNVEKRALTERLGEVRAEPVDFVEFPAGPVERMAEEFWQYIGPMGYMLNQRGFTEETLKHFGVGYSHKRDMVIVPMHEPSGKFLIGFIGRSIQEKVFKNSNNLPKSKTLWNYHRARKHGETVIIVESSFDAMRIHQAGYPNVVAALGGHLSEHHVEQLGKTFSTIVIMTDFDKRIYRPNCGKCRHLKECEGHRPGRELGWKIAEALKNKKIMWAAYDDTCVYPHGAKDAGDMTDEEIRQCLRNATSHFAYSRWGIEEKDDTVAVAS